MTAPFEVGDKVQLRLGATAKFEDEINRQIVPGAAYLVGSVDLDDNTIRLQRPTGNDWAEVGWVEWSAFELALDLRQTSLLPAPLLLNTDLDPRRLRALRIAERVVVRQQGGTYDDTAKRVEAILALAMFLTNDYETETAK